MKMILKLIGPLVLMALSFSLLAPCVHIHISAQEAGAGAGATNRQATASSTATATSTTTALERLQGTWEGRAGKESGPGQKVTITIAGNSLRFQGATTNNWYEVTFTLPQETVPQELRATITGCQQTNDIGAVVRAIFKIEDGTLTLVGIRDRDKESPKTFGNSSNDTDKSQVANKSLDESFNFNFAPSSLPGVTDGSKAFEDDSMFRYELRKVQPPQKRNADVGRDAL